MIKEGYGYHGNRRDSNMSMLIKKISRGSRGTLRRASEPIPLPKRPPSPTLAHLTSEEISILNNVFRRQEEFEKQEEDRIKRLERDLRHLEGSVRRNSGNKARLKQVDLRLCRLCYTTKFADGIGRICHDCNRRVCNKCGCYTKLKWDPKKNRHVKGRWRCVLCQKRREYACVSGEWFHGQDAKPALNNRVFQRKLTDMWSGAESDWGHMSAPGGYECMHSASRTDTEVFPADRESPRSFRRSHGRRRTYSEESCRYQEDEDGEVDDELFWLERQKCRRERMEMQKRSGRRRSSASTGKPADEDSPQYDYPPSRRDSIPSPEKRKERRSSKSESVYPGQDFGSHSNKIVEASPDSDVPTKFCKVHGYHNSNDLQTEARMRAAGFLSGKVRRSSSDGNSLDQSSLPHTSRFVRDEPLDSHSSDTVAVLSKGDLDADGMLNPHLSSFKKETLSSGDLPRNKGSRPPSSCYDSSSSVFVDEMARSRASSSESRWTPGPRRSNHSRPSRASDKAIDDYRNSPKPSWNRPSGERGAFRERWDPHDVDGAVRDDYPSRETPSSSRRFSGDTDTPDLGRRVTENLESPELVRRLSGITDTPDNARRKYTTRDSIEYSRRSSGLSDNQPYRRQSGFNDVADMGRRYSNMVDTPETERRHSGAVDSFDSSRRQMGLSDQSELYRRQSGATEALNTRSQPLFETLDFGRRQSNLTDTPTFARRKSGLNDSTGHSRRQSGAQDTPSHDRRVPVMAEANGKIRRHSSRSDSPARERRYSGISEGREYEPLRKSSSLGSDRDDSYTLEPSRKSSNEDGQRRHSYDPPRRPGVRVERKHSDPNRRYIVTPPERRESFERLRRMESSSRELYDPERRSSTEHSVEAQRRESSSGRRDSSSREPSRKHSSSGRDMEVKSRSPSREGERRRSSTSSRPTSVSRSRESVSGDRDNTRDNKHSSRREDNDKMRRMSRRSSHAPFKVTFTCEKKEDGTCRTSSLGLRVVGGKTGPDGKLGATITYVAKNSAAEKAGLRPGDQILEWNGQRLVDTTFEEAKKITDRSGSTVTITAVRPKEQPNNENKREDSSVIPHWHQESEVRRASNLESSRDVSVSKQLRRSLPRIPVEIANKPNKESYPITGQICLKMWQDWRTAKLHVTVMRAQALLTREGPEKELPQAFVQLYLLPNRNLSQHYRTDTISGSNEPDWNTTYIFDDMTEEELRIRSLEVTVWDFFPYKSSRFLGEVLLDLNAANLQDQPTWYPLSDHDENSAPLPNASPKPRPRSSAPSILEKEPGAQLPEEEEGRSNWASLPLLPATPAHDKVKELLHKRSLPSQKSLEGDSADTTESTIKDTKSNKLKKQSNKKKTSSQSSLSTTDDEAKPVRESFRSKVRRRMSDVVTRVGARLADKRSLSEDECSRQSLEVPSAVPRRSHSNVTEGAKSNNISNANAYHQGLLTTPAAHSAGSSMSSSPPLASCTSNSIDLDDGLFMYNQDSDNHEFDSMLGVGQVAPRPNMRTTVQGDILLGFMVTKGHLELDVLGARELSLNNANQPPDTYVKTCLMEGLKKIQRKKTRTIKGSTEPRYGHKIKYSSVNVQGRYMRIQVKGKCGGFERNQCLGEVVVKLNDLDLSKHTRTWYKLFQHSLTEFGSTESL